MEWMNDLADWAGELRARRDRPVYEMRAELARQQQQKELQDAFDQVSALQAQKRQAQNPQVPLRPQTFSETDQLKLHQQMNRAGIDPQKIAAANLEQERLGAFRDARSGIENPYALGNLANTLDVSPVRQSGGITYNRFDATDPILNMTAAVRAEGRLKGAQADRAVLNNEVLAGFLKDPDSDPTMKLDVANNKAVTKTDKAVLIGKDGKKQYFRMNLQPDGSWAYSPAVDQGGESLRVPAEEGQTSLAKNMVLLSEKMEISDGEALQILTNTRRKSAGQLYEEAVKMAATSPKTGYGANMEAVDVMAGELFALMRPNEAPPTQAVVEKVNQGNKESQLKTAPDHIARKARASIEKGADPQKVAQRLQLNGYSTEGIL